MADVATRSVRVFVNNASQALNFVNLHNHALDNLRSFIIITIAGNSNFRPVVHAGMWT